jgi:feruloyl esterase
MMLTRVFFIGACSLLLASAVAGLSGQAQPAQTSVPAASADARRCSDLARADFETIPEAPTRITSARLVDVSPVTAQAPPGSPVALLAASTIKQYCQVLGYVAPQNKFELRLPIAAQWNGKFHLTACAGLCGAVNGVGCIPALVRGYASVTGNGGHDGGQGWDAVWAANSPSLQEDYGWRHNHVITLAAKAITTRYYDRPIARSYMSGCSKGGQAVLMEAQRFPSDFDGLLPIAPVYDLTGRSMAGAWFAQAVSDGRHGSVLDTAAADAVHKSVLGRCGAQAGVDEGFVTDPASCDWRPEMAACGAGAEAACLTPRQVDAIKRLMSPVLSSKGQVVYAYPYIPGTETEWAGWNFMPSGGPASNYLVNDQMMKYMIDPTVRQGTDPLKFNFDRDPSTTARASTIYNATSFDLKGFKSRGGKMLMWHGLADGGVMATSSIGYYKGVEKLMGGRAQTQDFFRLFLIPGMHHCAGGPGLTQFDAMTLLEDWVEKGQAPDVLMASRSVNGAIERTRPIYPYPVLARYSGSGDPKAVSSFVPFDPTR